MATWLETDMFRLPRGAEGVEGKPGGWLSTVASASVSTMSGQWMDGGQSSLRPLTGGDPAFVLSHRSRVQEVKFQNWARTYGCCPSGLSAPSVEEVKRIEYLVSEQHPMVQPPDLQFHLDQKCGSEMPPERRLRENFPAKTPIPIPELLARQQHHEVGSN